MSPLPPLPTCVPAAAVPANVRAPAPQGTLLLAVLNMSVFDPSRKHPDGSTLDCTTLRFAAWKPSLAAAAKHSLALVAGVVHAPVVWVA
jgi:hypothetical protein